jgi:hypothetical protein
MVSEYADRGCEQDNGTEDDCNEGDFIGKELDDNEVNNAD